MHTPAAPARPYSRTARTVLVASPKPLSASTITGIWTLWAIRRVASTLLAIVTRFTSGMANWAAETPKPLTHNAGKSRVFEQHGASASCAPHLQHLPPLQWDPTPNNVGI